MILTRLEFRNFLFAFLNTRLGLFLSYIHRTQNLLRFEFSQLFRKVFTIWRSREFVNFTYLLSDDARTYLPHFVSSLVGCSVTDAEATIRELESDHDIANYYAVSIRNSNRRWSSDDTFRPGRLLLHYALVRITKPRIVFEAGLDKGFGSIIMNRALARNRSEGFEARYIGVEYRADRPVFLHADYPDRVGQIRYAPWSDELQRLEKDSVDFLFYDAVGAEEEFKKFVTYSDRFSNQAIIISAWSLPVCFDIADRIGRHVTVFHAKSKNHWFPGSELSIIYPKNDKIIRFQSHQVALAQEGI